MALINVVKHYLSVVIYFDCAWSLHEAEIMDLLRTQSVNVIIVKTILISTALFVPIAEIMNKLFDRVIKKCCHHKQTERCSNH